MMSATSEYDSQAIVAVVCVVSKRGRPLERRRKREVGEVRVRVR